jgi:hypothetical protein
MVARQITLTGIMPVPLVPHKSCDVSAPLPYAAQVDVPALNCRESHLTGHRQLPWRTVRQGHWELPRTAVGACASRFGALCPPAAVDSDGRRGNRRRQVDSTGTETLSDYRLGTTWASDLGPPLLAVGPLPINDHHPSVWHGDRRSGEPPEESASMQRRGRLTVRGCSILTSD